MSNSTKDLAKTCHCIDRDVHCLTYEQVERLYGVVSEPVQIYPKEGNFPTLSIPPSALVKLVLTKLDNRGINVRDVRLNGSGASFCLAEEREKEPKPHYNDLDIIFRIDTKSEHDLNTIKDEVLSTLFEFFPEGTQTGRISSFMLEEYYVKKRVKVSSNSDRWSLISLGDDNGKNIELKFVSSMKRQYEFSIDSFQIILDPLLHCSIQETSSSNNTVSISTPKFLPDSFPQIQAISLYDDFNKALHHLNNRLIATNNPEEIRGGGLLKYCYLLVNGYQASDHQEMEAHEPYMCSRFFIDFPHMNLQFTKIHKYIYTRFLQPGVPEKGLEFLEALLCIIMNKAKCLMESERYKSMRVLQQLQVNLLWQYGSPLYKFQMYHPHPPHSPAHTQPFCFPMPPQSNIQSSSSYSNRIGNNTTQTNSHNVSSSCVSTTSQPFKFPHTLNNAVPIGPTPTPVR